MTKPFVRSLVPAYISESESLLQSSSRRRALELLRWQSRARTAGTFAKDGTQLSYTLRDACSQTPGVADETQTQDCTAVSAERGISTITDASAKTVEVAQSTERWVDERSEPQRYGPPLAPSPRSAASEQPATRPDPTPICASVKSEPSGQSTRPPKGKFPQRAAREEDDEGTHFQSDGLSSSMQPATSTFPRRIPLEQEVQAGTCKFKARSNGSPAQTPKPIFPRRIPLEPEAKAGTDVTQSYPNEQSMRPPKAVFPRRIPLAHEAKTGSDVTQSHPNGQSMRPPKAVFPPRNTGQEGKSRAPSKDVKGAKSSATKDYREPYLPEKSEEEKLAQKREARMAMQRAATSYGNEALRLRLAARPAVSARRPRKKTKVSVSIPGLIYEPAVGSSSQSSHRAAKPARRKVKKRPSEGVVERAFDLDITPPLDSLLPEAIGDSQIEKYVADVLLEDSARDGRSCTSRDARVRIPDRLRTGVSGSGIPRRAASGENRCEVTENVLPINVDKERLVDAYMARAWADVGYPMAEESESEAEVPPPKCTAPGSRVTNEIPERPLQGEQDMEVADRGVADRVLSHDGIDPGLTDQSMVQDPYIDRMDETFCDETRLDAERRGEETSLVQSVSRGMERGREDCNILKDQRGRADPEPRAVPLSECGRVVPCVQNVPLPESSPVEPHAQNVVLPERSPVDSRAQNVPLLESSQMEPLDRHVALSESSRMEPLDRNVALSESSRAQPPVRNVALSESSRAQPLDGNLAVSQSSRAELHVRNVPGAETSAAEPLGLSTPLQDSSRAEPHERNVPLPDTLHAEPIAQNTPVSERPHPFREDPVAERICAQPHKRDSERLVDRMDEKLEEILSVSAVSDTLSPTAALHKYGLNTDIENFASETRSSARRPIASCLREIDLALADLQQELEKEDFI